MTIDIERAAAGDFALVDTNHGYAVLCQLAGWGDDCGSDQHVHSDMVGYIDNAAGEVICAEGLRHFRGYRLSNNTAN